MVSVFRQGRRNGKHVILNDNHYKIDMKAYFSIVTFVVLLSSSLITGADSYLSAKYMIESDLNQALARTLEEKGGAWITADTIKVCRQLQSVSSEPVSMLINDDRFVSNLSVPQLRDRSYISFCIFPGSRCADVGGRQLADVCGDTLIVNASLFDGSRFTVAFRAYAECSFSMILGLSDQNIPVALSFAAVLWAVCSFIYMRRHYRREDTFGPVQVCADVVNASCPFASGSCDAHVIYVGSMSFNSATGLFYNTAGDEVRLTPMQFELMKMFFTAETHKLSKADICRALWPGKDDASETLYTLMRRLKPVIESNSNLKIEVERGKAYKLTVNAGSAHTDV